MILLIDNYDSFTFNLVQRLGEIDSDIDLAVHRNDQITVEQITGLAPTHIIISPGPCTPREAGVSVDVVRRLSPYVPMLGVCLGHQSIGFAYGAEIVRAVRLMHGKTDFIHHDNSGLFSGLDNPFEATRYHSLVIRPGTLSDEFEVCAWCEAPDGSREIMGVRHRRYRLHGLQFHPESFLTPSGSEMLERFIALQPADWSHVAKASTSPTDTSRHANC